MEKSLPPLLGLASPQISVYNLYMGVVYTSKQLVALIQKDGWIAAGHEGSHLHFRHPVKTGKVTIPVHNKDIRKGTANNILKQAGLK